MKSDKVEFAYYDDIPTLGIYISNKSDSNTTVTRLGIPMVYIVHYMTSDGWIMEKSYLVHLNDLTGSTGMGYDSTDASFPP